MTPSPAARATRGAESIRVAATRFCDARRWIAHGVLVACASPLLACGSRSSLDEFPVASTSGRAGGVSAFGEDAQIGNRRPCTPTDAVGEYDDLLYGALSPPLKCAYGLPDYSEIVIGWGWDGTACFPVVGCVCNGPDCGNLLPRKSACVQAYAHCVVDGG